MKNRKIVVDFHSNVWRDLMKISEMQELAHETAKGKGWHDPAPNFGESIALIHSELSEALEAYREGLPLAYLLYGEGGKPEGIPAELADVLIRIGDMCGAFGIDLEAAVKEKMEYNKKRSYRHGGKVL